jgi:hypothetical protein
VAWQQSFVIVLLLCIVRRRVMSVWLLCDSTGSPGKGAKTDQNVWPLPRFKNFQRHKCFDDSRFCLIFSFGGNYENSVETILVETNIFWWKLLLFGGN